MNIEYIYNRVLNDDKKCLRGLLNKMKSRFPHLYLDYSIMEEENTFTVNVRMIDKSLLMTGDYHMMYAAIDGLCDWMRGH